MKEIKVLDYGFVRLRNVSGPTRRTGMSLEDVIEGTPLREFDADDVDPANAARMSFDQTDSGRTESQDMRLCEYLMKNLHTSPFEMIEVWMEMKLPIFLARQFVRHRTVSLNEVSGRYVELPAEWYVPTPDTVMFQSSDKKQGGDQVDMSDAVQASLAENFVRRLNENCAQSYESYKYAKQVGIALEQARFHLHVNHYTHWLWKQNLHNMMHFLSLRLHGHAQFEARVLAQAMYDLLAQVLPKTMALFDEYRRR